MTHNWMFGLLIVLLLYWRWRNLYYTRLSLRYRYRLFALRDKLRVMLAKEEDHMDDLTFQLLDASLSSTIQHLDRFNFWTYAIVRSFKPLTQDRNAVIALHRHITSHEDSRMIIAEHQRIIRDYFYQKHYFITALALALRKSGLMMDGLKKWLRKQQDQIVALFMPEQERELAAKVIAQHC